MSFVWPEALWLLLAVPALVGLYLLLLRRKSKTAMRFRNHKGGNHAPRVWLCRIGHEAARFINENVHFMPKD